MTSPMATQGMDAIVLAGGQGSRMGGVSKPFLPLEGESLVQRVLSFVRPRIRRIFVVTRSKDGWGWVGPDLLTDDRPEGGPLVGLARGLEASDAEWCFLVGCDMPFLQGAVVEYMAARTIDVEAVALRTGRLYQPLHAFYKRSCRPIVEQLLASGLTSVQDILRNVQVDPLEEEDVHRLDPEMLSFRDASGADARRRRFLARWSPLDRGASGEGYAVTGSRPRPGPLSPCRPEAGRSE